MEHVGDAGAEDAADAMSVAVTGAELDSFGPESSQYDDTPEIPYAVPGEEDEQDAPWAARAHETDPPLDS